MSRKLILEIELESTDCEDQGLEAVENIFDNLKERLPADLADTNGDLAIHASDGTWIGRCRIE